jgi:hypothetical protein
MFMEMARTASRDDLPLLIWIGFHPVRNEAGASVFTTGLDAFDLMDLEVRDSKHEPSVILERLLDLAAYCILTGKPLKDGDTVGHSDAERIPVKHVPSAFIPGRMVCRIVL